MKRRIKRVAGLAMIEFTLTVAMFVATMSVAADLYMINRTRGEYDRISHTLASVLSVQSYLSSEDIDQLLSAAIPSKEIGDYELHIYKVNLDRSMDWKPLQRGELSGICPTLNSGDVFSSDLPEEDSDNSDDAIMVVQLCGESGGLTPFASLIDNKVMAVTAYNRTQYNDIDVDKTLAAELGVDEEDDDE
ncbi:pilus assembly protein [Vibrio sp. CAIM 722]|uniref:Pilus assembly protein n=1 Tax=Vibrio eleionomae TaxID=2653505 RepID=A0A7X4LJB3_9VIBR|nr:tight adherence pilus pseudopilin TadF [Vibrio eleionomae]MZI92891.1 pilus assembly protein [Vibrio eleionomae]